VSLVQDLPLLEGADVPLEGAAPVVKWAGGKRSLFKQLLALSPHRFKRFYEPFLGGGGFFLSLAPAQAVIGDANPDLIQLYRAIRDDPQVVMAALDELQPRVQDREHYYQVRAQDPAALSAAEQAARFIYLNKTCYNGLYRVNRQGRFNVPFGRYVTPPQLYGRQNFERVASLLRRAEIRCGDFEEILADAGAGDFAYLDPPYVPLTATARFTSYTSGSFGEGDQRRLAETIHALTDRGCRILLSNSDTPFVRELYASYDIQIVLAPRSINSDAAGRNRIPELAILNFATDGD
jgi:DNA adenine methylase